MNGQFQSPYYLNLSLLYLTILFLHVSLTFSTAIPCNPLPTDYKFIVDISLSGQTPSYQSVTVSSYSTTFNYVYACGTSGSYALMTGVDEVGSLLFSEAFWSSSSTCVSIKASPIDQYFYIFGSTYVSPDSQQQYIGKFDTALTKNWMVSLGGTSNDYLTDGVVSDDGTMVYGIGYTGSFAVGGNDYCIVGYTDVGVFVFYKTYGTTANEQLNGGVLDSTGSYLVLTGQSKAYLLTNHWDIVVFKYNVISLENEWAIYMGNKAYSEIGYQIGYSLYDVGYYLLASTNEDTYTSPVLSKLDSYGNLEYAYKIGGITASDTCSQFTTNGDGRILYLTCSFVSTSLMTSADAGAVEPTLLKILGSSCTVLSSLQLSVGVFTSYSYAVTLDYYGNLVWTFNTNSPTWIVATQAAVIVRMTPELQDYSCFSNNLVSFTFSSLTSVWQVGTLEPQINFIDYYSTTLSQVTSGNPNTDYVSFSLVTPYSCALRNTIIAAVNTVQTMYKYESASITLSYFCVGSTETFANYLSYDYDSTHLLLPSGLSYDKSTSILSGIPSVAAGLYEMKAYLSTPEPSSSTFLLMIIDGNGPQLVNDFYIFPNRITLNYYLFSVIDPDEFFWDTVPFKVTAYQKNGITYSSLPSWLNYNPSNYTFYGTPTTASFSTLPAYLHIALMATDIYGNTMYSTTDTLVIDNVALYVNQSQSVPSVVCVLPSQAQPFIYQFASNYFYDQYNQQVTYTMVKAPSSSIPDNMYFDTSSHTLFGKPILSGNVYQMYLKAQDGSTLQYNYAYVMFSIAVRTMPVLSSVDCLSLRIVSVARPNNMTLDYTSCLQESDSIELVFTAIQANGDELPYFMSVDSSLGTIFVNSTMNDSAGIYQINVTASEIDYSCFYASIATQITLNYAPVVSLNEASVIQVYQPAYKGMGFQIQLEDYFYDPDEGDSLTLSSNISSTSWIQLSQINNYLFGTPSQTDIDSHTWVLLTATDTFSASASIVLEVIVINYTFPGSYNSLQEFTTYSAYNFSFQIDQSQFYNYVDQILYFSMKQADNSALQNWIQFDGTSLSIEGYAPSIDESQVYQYILTFTDNNQSSNFTYLSLKVLPLEISITETYNETVEIIQHINTSQMHIISIILMILMAIVSVILIAATHFKITVVQKSRHALYWITADTSFTAPY